MQCTERRARVRVALALGCGLTVGARVEAADLFVATTGVDATATAGTQASPFQTIQYAAARAMTGDTINVMPGNHAGFVLGSTSPTSPAFSPTGLTIRPAPGTSAAVVIDRVSALFNRAPPGTPTALGFVVNTSDVTIRGLRFAPATTDVQGGLGIDHSTRVTVEDCQVSGVVYEAVGVRHGTAIRLTRVRTNAGMAGVSVSDGSSDVSIVSSRVVGATGVGMYVGATGFMSGAMAPVTDVVLDGNIVRDMPVPTGQPPFAVALWIDGASRITVTNQGLFRNGSVGLFVGSPTPSPTFETSDIKVLHATAVGDVDAPIVAIGAASGVALENSILLHSLPGPTYYFADEAWASIGTAFSASHNIVRTLADGDPIAAHGSQSLTFVTLASWRTMYTADATIRSMVGALFATPFDGHLSADSPAINAGKVQGAVPTDFEGDPRNDGLPDIGFDEALPPMLADAGADADPADGGNGEAGPTIPGVSYRGSGCRCHVLGGSGSNGRASALGALGALFVLGALGRRRGSRT